MDAASPTIRAYRRTFGERAAVLARAPGRVNLVGEHTDYNDGLVFPFAIGQGVEVAAGRGRRALITAHSVAMGQTMAFNENASDATRNGAWQNYLRGIVAGLRERGIDVAGVNLCIGGDLPPRQGLSSSAALCVAVALALAAQAESAIEPMQLVDLARTAERDFAGTPCGIMDPYVSVFGRAGYAILLDCRSLQHRYVAITLRHCQLVAIPSGMERALNRGPYERRVVECEEAVAAIRKAGYNLDSLRDVTEPMLDSAVATSNPVLTRRVRHVVRENARVMQAVEALKNSRMEELGRLLNDTHDSLRQNYEVSCPEMDSLVATLQARSGVLGARMIGGGFGGTLLALVRDEAVAGLIKYMAGESPAGPVRGRPIPVSPGGGARVRWL